MGKQDICKLSETPTPNYDAWEFRTRISARAQGLLDTVLGTDTEPSNGHSSKAWKAWKARHEAAAELLVKSLADDQLIHVRGLDSEPALMWASLRTVHEKTGVTGSAKDLWNRFHSITYTDPSIPLRTHIGTIRSYAEALDRLHNDKPSDTQIISRIFTSLPPSYSTIIKILTNHEKEDDIDFIVERILAEETTQKSDTTSNNSVEAVRALLANRSLSQTLICETPVCKAKGRTGHLTEDCFWPGGGKEGQWPEWWHRLKGNSPENPTPTAHFATSVVPSGIVTPGTHFAL